ncbi:MAG: hypothetical protein LBK40_07580 [Spirochaetaceae bacterium]|nr:hypothetical protein [Spirochaetaceae bacterium]
MEKNCFKVLALFPVLGIFSLVSCTDFFSTSLATWAQRDRTKLNIKVTASNVDDLIAQNGNDPDTSLAILKGIEAALKGASGQSKLDLESAALEAAANAAGLGNTVLGKSQEILDAIDSGVDADVLALVENVIDSLDNLGATASTLLAALPDPGDPTAFEAFIENSDPTKLALAAAVLLASEAEQAGGASGYIAGFTGTPSSPNEAMAVAIAGGIASNYASTEEGTVDAIIENMLKQLKLI